MAILFMMVVSGGNSLANLHLLIVVTYLRATPMEVSLLFRTGQAHGRLGDYRKA